MKILQVVPHTGNLVNLPDILAVIGSLFGLILAVYLLLFTVTVNKRQFMCDLVLTILSCSL